MKQTFGKIKCCLCAADIVYNEAAMCADCIKSQVDIRKEIDVEEKLHQCRDCMRFDFR